MGPDFIRLGDQEEMGQKGVARQPKEHHGQQEASGAEQKAQVCRHRGPCGLHHSSLTMSATLETRLGQGHIHV